MAGLSMRFALSRKWLLWVVLTFDGISINSN
jgi:hypothetical protein